MTLSRPTKTVLYAVVGLFMCALAAWTAEPMYSSELSVAVYLRSVVLLCVAACVVLGVGVYIWFFHTRKTRCGRSDAIFWSVVGAVLLLAAVIVTLRFGGMTQQTLGEAAAAINLNLMLIGMLPAPFLVRTIVLAVGVREGKKQQTVAAVFAVVSVLAYIGLIVSGHLLRTIDIITL